MNLDDLAKSYHDEASAIAFLEALRWPNGVFCPHCGVIGESFRMQSRPETKNKMRPGLWKCGACRKTFTVRVGTIFEDSHIPLHKWLMAYHLICSSKKGMSAHQLHRMLGVTYKTAWFMAHRIRYTMTEGALTRKMSGTVEVDETFVGGKLRVDPHAVKPGERPKDRLSAVDNKTPVVALVERGGRVRSFPVERVTAANLKPILTECISEDARLNTDENKVYKFARKHSNTPASKMTDDSPQPTRWKDTSRFLSAGCTGHSIMSERSIFTAIALSLISATTARKITDGERAVLAVKGAEGKRLMYK